MTRGELAFAKRKALELFDAWNDVTGCFQLGTSYYSEICAVIEDAVEVGAMTALEVKFTIKDGELIKLDSK